MVATEPLTGARVPEQSDGPLGGLQAGNAVKDLADNTHPRFANNSSRDAAFAAWVAEGGTMVDGLHCTVAGSDQVYRSGQWRGVSARVYTTTTVDDAVKSAAATVMSVAVPDPGWPYVVVATAQVLIGTLGAGVTVHGNVRVGSTDINPATLSKTNPTSGNISNELLFTSAEAVSATLTGGQTIGFHIYKDTGIPGNGYQVPSGPYNRLAVKVFPA